MRKQRHEEVQGHIIDKWCIIEPPDIFLQICVTSTVLQLLLKKKVPVCLGRWMLSGDGGVRVQAPAASSCSSAQKRSASHQLLDTQALLRTTLSVTCWVQN